MTLFDHLFALVLAVAMPIAGSLSFQRLLRRVDAGKSVNRNELYQANTWMLWTLLLLLFFLWLANNRSWNLLGLRLDIDVWFMLSVALTVAGIILLIMQIRQVEMAKVDEIRTLRQKLGNIEIIIPHSGNELRRYYGLSITAGVVEETLWRGFMIWYFSHFMPVWAAALLSVIGFGIAHAYQGISQIPKITLVGAAFTGLYLVSGSLWLPMILHAAVDILQGRAGYEMIRRDDNHNEERMDEVPI